MLYPPIDPRLTTMENESQGLRPALTAPSVSADSSPIFPGSSGGSGLKPLLPKNVFSKIDFRGLDECWIWNGCKSKGYGLLRYKRKIFRAHRFVWSAVNGEIPNGKLVCHKCDVPSCVNPSHLFIGTDLDNALDKVKKGRHKCGIGGKCKHTIDTLKWASELRRSGYRYSSISEITGVPKSTLLSFMNGISRQRYPHDR